MNVIPGTPGFERYFTGTFMQVADACRDIIGKRETGPLEITLNALRAGSLSFFPTNSGSAQAHPRGAR